jgi:rubrerythrin
MAIHYNAREVFEIGIQIERNGARFYRLAADRARDTRVKDTFLRLARMEDDHERLFGNLLSRLPPDAGPVDGYDPDEQAVRHLHAAAGTHVFNVRGGAPQRMGGMTTPQEVLRAAMEFEKDSIVCFLGMRDMVPENLGRAHIEALISEEMDHIATLAEQYGSLQPGG